MSFKRQLKRKGTGRRPVGWYLPVRKSRPSPKTRRKEREAKFRLNPRTTRSGALFV